MSGMTTQDLAGGRKQAPISPAQGYAALAGAALVVLGTLSLILEDVSFGTVGALADQPEFLIWTVSGWTTIFWIAMGAFGLLSAARRDSARSYAGAAGIIFAAVAAWGFIDGNDVVNLLAANTTNNVMHAALAGLGLLAAALPPGTGRTERTADADAGVTARPLSRDASRTRRSGQTLG